MEGLSEEVRNPLVTVSSMLSEVEQQQQQQSQRNIVAAGGRGCVGRPRLEITAEQLEYLFGYDLTFRDVAEALGVSESTVKRRARKHGISVRDWRSNMTDHELDEVLRQIKVIPWYCIAHPYCARFSRHQRAHMPACTCKT